jgi:hypothetical protein
VMMQSCRPIQRATAGDDADRLIVCSVDFKAKG